MHRNGAPTGKESTITCNFSRLAHDVVELSELQAQLFRLDAQAITRRARAGAVLGAGALVVLLGCTPVALWTLAEALVYSFDWSRLAALAAATAFGLTLCAILIAFAWRSVTRGMASFQRSRNELSRNVAWLKSALQAQGSRETRVREEPSLPYPQ